MSEKGSEILAYTCAYGDQGNLHDLIYQMRGSAGLWFDWLLCLGAPSARLREQAEEQLRDPKGEGIQHLKIWKENRGQHHATELALGLAQTQGYKWLLRLDPDVTPRTKRWLKKMITCLEELKNIKQDEFYRFVAAPRIVGLNNPLHPEGVIEAGQNFPAEVMTILGGACRLHPMELMEEYKPPIYDPIGRGDPESLSNYLEGTIGGMLIRFPHIRMVHRTDEIEGKDTQDQALQRRMSKYWPWLGEAV